MTVFLSVIQQDQRNSRKNKKLIPVRKIIFKALIQISKGGKDMQQYPYHTKTDELFLFIASENTEENDP